jgi:hypothetical protein
MGCFAKWRASFAGVPRRNQVRIAVAMFFTFPPGRPLECRAVGRGVRGRDREDRGVVRVPWRVFQRLPPGTAHPLPCVEAYYLRQTRFETIAQRKVRRRRLTEDGNVEISGPICVRWQEPTLTGAPQTAAVDPEPPFVAGDEITRPRSTGQPTRWPPGRRPGKRRSLRPKR